jgi:hypothetical protein
MNKTTNIEQTINELKDAAKKAGLEIKFRNRKTKKYQDFCIFIYDRNFRKNTYAVGFDGSWDADKTSPTHFDNCVKIAYDWIENRDSRFIKKDGQWVSIIKEQ